MGRLVRRQPQPRRYALLPGSYWPGRCDLDLQRAAVPGVRPVISGDV